MTVPTADRRRGLIVLALALALGITGCGGLGSQTGPYIEEPTDRPLPDDDGPRDNLDDDGELDDEP